MSVQLLLTLIVFDLFTVEGQTPRETAYLIKKLGAKKFILIMKIKDSELED